MSLAIGASLQVVSAEDPETEDSQPLESLAITSAATFNQSLTGRVYVWDQGRLRPASQARVSTGSAQVRTDSSGWFEFAPEDRTGNLSIVQPGYDIVRRPIYYDQSGRRPASPGGPRGCTSPSAK